MRGRILGEELRPLAAQLKGDIVLDDPARVVSVARCASERLSGHHRVIDPFAILCELRRDGRRCDGLAGDIVGHNLGPSGQVAIADVDELELSCLADQGQRLFLVLQTGKLDDDPARALQLDERFGDAEPIDAVLDDLACGFDRCGIDLHISGEIGLKQDLDPSLQIQSQADLDWASKAQETDMDPWVGRQRDPGREAADEQDDYEHGKRAVSHRWSDLFPQSTPSPARAGMRRYGCLQDAKPDQDAHRHKGSRGHCQQDALWDDLAQALPAEDAKRGDEGQGERSAGEHRPG